MLIYSLYSMRKLRKTVEFSTLSKTAHASANCRIYESGQIKTAFILGFFSPVIYLPKGLGSSKKQMILEHESVHIRRHDHQIKMAAWIILSLHWFNPLMWVSFYFLNKDMELSCDEQVLINLGSQIRADYSVRPCNAKPHFLWDAACVQRREHENPHQKYTGLPACEIRRFHSRNPFNLHYNIWLHGKSKKRDKRPRNRTNQTN